MASYKKQWLPEKNYIIFMYLFALLVISILVTSSQVNMTILALVSLLGILLNLKVSRLKI